MSKTTVLLVDDEAGIRFGMRNFLNVSGFEVLEAGSCREAEERLKSIHPDVAILDYSLPDGNALTLMTRLREIAPTVPIIILTGFGTIDLAVQAIKEGAEHFLTKPVELPALIIIINRLVENNRNRRKQLARKSHQAQTATNPFLGTSPAIRQLEDQAQKIVGFDSPVLLQGETGTGKGVLANWLHTNSPRSEEAFVELNCAGLSKEFLDTELFGHEKGAFTSAVTSKPGLFEVAHRGTVFLDEIGDMDLQVQPKLLKVLEERRFRRMGGIRDVHVDIRLIAATHEDVNRQVQDRTFRSDLYFRLSTIPLTIPPLRERKEDILLLAQLFLDSLAAGFGRREVELSTSAQKALVDYAWPGNIRELRNVLERAVLLSNSSVLQVKDFRFEAYTNLPATDETLHMTLDELECFHIERILQAEQGRVERAAQRLGVPRSSLYQKLKRFGIQKPE
ncbi:MAG TPA: sigma-54 dependent transcriptional regulator [Acidobacteriota bacterium]|nr:sigma-54 dependent transcriptional regulator [Acidobacteriota bacterium]HNB72601.1 sigma-54 dependent transcriptional regulator [Acidobacteriota bacterium]HND19142.1 sigma-54 dependent transcriptional regulator [Acidobacteriota bacterium]